MTTIEEYQVKCNVCGNIETQTMIMSTSQYGSEDLDTRPSRMYRSTIAMWLNECSQCGYVSESVDDELTIDADFLESKEYKNCDGIDFKSYISEMFYKKYLIEKKKSDDMNTFLYALRCAWTCDDMRDYDNAKLTRQIAIKVIDKITKLDDCNNENLLTIRADLLRRIGNFGQVIDEYENIRFKDETLNKIIEFQVDKSRKKDDKTYTLDDVNIDY